MGKRIITKNGSLILSAMLEDRKAKELHCYADTKAILNHIYIGKVKDVVPYLNAAFVQITPEVKGYLDLNHAKNCIFVNPKTNHTLCAGDEILVQVVKEAMKTKDPVLSCDLQIGNKYSVITYGKCFLGFSNKIKDEDWKEQVRKLCEPLITEQFGFIVRTNGYELTPQEIYEALKKLADSFNRLITTAMHRPCYYEVYKEPEGYLLDIQNSYSQSLQEIITDIPQIYDTIRLFLQENQPEDLVKLRLYEDASYPLQKAYSLCKLYQDAVNPHVWLKSGGYLIIEPTEALTVIDVNTGKLQSKKRDKEAVFYKLNLEACHEIARQLQIRNISGIVIIDFINMTPEYEKRFLEDLPAIFKQDSIPVHVAGITSLGLVELTRKKTKASIYVWKREIQEMECE